MTQSKMAAHAKNWKPPEARVAAKREAANKESADAKGPGPNAWKKGLGGKSKGKGC